MALTVITGIGACLGFYGGSKGAPLSTYFHTDEHLTFVGAELLRQSTHKAALSPKFFV